MLPKGHFFVAKFRLTLRAFEKTNRKIPPLRVVCKRSVSAVGSDNINLHDGVLGQIRQPGQLAAARSTRRFKRRNGGSSSSTHSKQRMYFFWVSAKTTEITVEYQKTEVFFRCHMLHGKTMSSRPSFNCSKTKNQQKCWGRKRTKKTGRGFWKILQLLGRTNSQPASQSTVGC